MMIAQPAPDTIMLNPIPESRIDERGALSWLSDDGAPKSPVVVVGRWNTLERDVNPVGVAEDVRHVTIDRSSRLEDVVAVGSAFPDATMLRVEKGSRLRSLKGLSLMKSLTRLPILMRPDLLEGLDEILELSLTDLFVNTITNNDLQWLLALRRLGSIRIDNFELDSLEMIDPLDVDEVSLGGDTCKKIGPSHSPRQRLTLSGMRELETLESVSTSRLQVSACRRLRLDSLRSTIGIKELNLVDLTLKYSVEFGEEVESVFISGSKVALNFLRDFKPGTSLERLWVTPWPRGVNISEVSDRFPSVIFSNGRYAFKASIKSELAQFYEAE